MDYRLRAIRDKYDLNDNDQKIACLRESYDLIARKPDQAVREIYGEDLAESLQVNKDTVKREIEATRNKLIKGIKAVEQKDEIRVERLFQPASRDLRYEDPESAAAEEIIISLLYLYPELIKTPHLPDPSDFSSSALGNIYQILCERIKDGAAISTNTLANSMSTDELGLLTRIVQKPQSAKRVKTGITDCIQIIKKKKELREAKDKNDYLLAFLKLKQEEENRNKYGKDYR